MTYRNVLNEKIIDVAYASIGGSPWADEVEQSLSALTSTIGAAIDRDPILAEIFNRQEEKKTTRDFPGCPEHFGGCPECGCNDGFLNVGSSHWFICHEHKTKWCVGSNLFDSWKDQTEAQQRAAYAKAEGYQEVESIYPKSTDAQDDERGRNLEEPTL